MNHMLLVNNLLMLAGGSIDGNKKPLDPEEYLGVTLAGIGIVIAALALLVVIIMLFGTIFDKLDGSKQRKETKAAAAKAPQDPVKKPAPVPAPKPAAAPAAPAVQGEEDEVIAVISAVVAMMSEADGKTYKIKSVKPAQGTGLSGRSAWAMDGRRSNVSPF